MSNIPKKYFRLIIAIVIVVIGAAFLGYQYWKSQRFALPKGIASGNGRIESKLVLFSGKECLKGKGIIVE